MFSVRFRPAEVRALKLRAREAKTTTAGWIRDRVRTALGIAGALVLVALFDYVVMGLIAR